MKKFNIFKKEDMWNKKITDLTAGETSRLLIHVLVSSFFQIISWCGVIALIAFLYSTMFTMLAVDRIGY